MKICKICGIEKPLNSYVAYRNYPTRYRHICKECEYKRLKEREKKHKEKLAQLENEDKEIIRKFNELKSSDFILKLLMEGFSVNWSEKNTIIFNKADKIVCAKHATKEMYHLIFERYCIELKKRFINDKRKKYDLEE